MTIPTQIVKPIIHEPVTHVGPIDVAPYLRVSALDLALNDGDPVTSWGVFNEVVANGVSPTFQAAGLNGRPTVHFAGDGANYLRAALDTAAFAGGSSFFLVGTLHDSPFAAAGIVSVGNDTDQDWDSVSSFTVTEGAPGTVQVRRESVCWTNVNNAMEVPLLVECYVRANGITHWAVNGRLVIFRCQSGGPIAPTKILLGCRIANGVDAPDQGANCEVSEVHFYDRFLNSAQRQFVRNKLANRWGIRRLPALDLDGDGNPDTVIRDGRADNTPTITEDDDSINVDLDNDGDADITFPK